MGIFSRFSDIVNANINAMLDKAEDPKKLVRLLIQEMEETLVELRSGAAKHIAERKELEKQLARAKQCAAQWQAKAELALSKGREDLARSALSQKQHSAEQVTLLEQELERYNELLSGVNNDADRLTQKMTEARARQSSLLARKTQAVTRLKVKQQLDSHKVEDALARFEQMEKKIDALEAEVESYDIGTDEQSIEAQFKKMERDESIEDALAELKQKMAS
ncbi:phage shock protein PspA [Psychrobium sp. 1_MG-2023]|uniref:phage shock protein PspA n=1 Tax=Psychrobium sp. 1_MG-2023 TaxID=3062624 RepID=UPI000C34D304|nr:phage shock protein PspA [Psychrobium sp. 1_MG-2023]MDP2559691.1 phage shock protein PspA [Psychrobium sp. 1_MG-2023]PKF59522.1 phage shock protein PspA [Alteromonadales bacterium alter-6D02]